MSTSKLSDEGQSGVCVACSHFSNSSAISGNSGCLKQHQHEPIHIHLHKLSRFQAILNTLNVSDGLVYWGLTPQQQPGSYQGGENDDEISFLVEETGVPGGNHRMSVRLRVWISFPNQSLVNPW